ncbi:MAG: hydratase [Clostridia bacterium]|nr:hydratase [Clostridia bacterium]
MVKLINEQTFLVDGRISATGIPGVDSADAAGRTIAARILADHNHGDAPAGEGLLKIRFDAMASHDITYVGIIQTARASGLQRFPIPYVLTNCHNSLCAVGGTINEDDHVFGLTAARKYGGIFVPPHQAVIHQYMRENFSGCGRMIIGSDSHTRYGALGTMAVGEGGPELVKQLLGRFYEIRRPDVVLIYLTGKPRKGVGPQDVALAIIREVFDRGFVKNSVMEFAGPGIASLSMDYRNGIDVMTTETACLSSVWVTDGRTEEYFRIHGRPEAFRRLEPQNGALYDRTVLVELDKVEPMIALPFHPGNAYTIREFLDNAEEILDKTEKSAISQFGGKVRGLDLKSKFRDGRFYVDQGIIAGCSGGTYENIMGASAILRKGAVGNSEYTLSVYPASQPVYAEIAANGALPELINAGVNVKTAFCGPCFGAGDVPFNNAFSIRHTTRNFPNREGSRPQDGQISWVALMDAASIAATSAMGGVLTPATDMDFDDEIPPYRFNDSAYRARVYNGFGNALPEEPLVLGPNITDWPRIDALPDNILLEVASVISDEVTTTDELIPSGETSSYRSNPLKLAEFALSRKDPGYVGRAKAVKAADDRRKEGDASALAGIGGASPDNTSIGSVVIARRPGDGSAREQAASCQRVLGGAANIALAYATKRYRSNLINWGMLPFTVAESDKDIFEGALCVGDRIYVPGIRNAILEGRSSVEAAAFLANGEKRCLTLNLGELSPEEKDIIVAGCLANYYNS